MPKTSPMNLIKEKCELPRSEFRSFHGSCCQLNQLMDVGSFLPEILTMEVGVVQLPHLLRPE